MDFEFALWQRLVVKYATQRNITQYTQRSVRNIRNIRNMSRSQFVKYAIYAICAKRFIRTAVDLQKCHTAHARRSHEALEADKMDEFCGMCLIFLHL